MKLILNGNGKSSMVGRKTVDLNVEPCPAIMADGIGGVCRRGWQYWLENGGSGPLNRIPKDGSTVDEDPEAFG